ncbi:MAG: PH domain-containing protein [Hamadaea sp.]|nr:PH domain-containing protein [Hamadaea sp.]NUT04340.1 PH domain-containing protein [Hamadaea sp.]
MALLAFLLRLAYEAGWYGPDVRPNLALGYLMPLGVPIVAFTLLAWWATRRAAVTIGDGVFVVPANPAAAGFAIIGANLLGELVPVAPPGAEPGIDGDAVDWTFTAVMGTSILLISIAVFVLRRPQLVLDAAGITVQHLFRRHTVRWDEIADVRRITRPPTIRLVLHSAAVFGLARESVDLAVGWLFVNPDVLQVVIDHYAAHPEDRAAIGTAEEAARLRAYAADQAAWA